MNSAMMKLAGRVKKDAPTNKAEPCKMHPKYKGLKPPASSKPGCTCQAFYDFKSKT